MHLGQQRLQPGRHRTGITAGTSFEVGAALQLLAVIGLHQLLDGFPDSDCAGRTVGKRQGGVGHTGVAVSTNEYACISIGRHSLQHLWSRLDHRFQGGTKGAAGRTPIQQLGLLRVLNELVRKHI